MKTTSSSVALALLATIVALHSASGQIVYSASGASDGDIVATVNSFRVDLGALNPNVVGSFGTGRREINWDGVPDTFSSPNSLPGNFFNVNSPRGVVFATPGTGFQVSADSDNPTATPTQFGNIDPNYPMVFEPFSAQRLFTAIGSNIVDVNFLVPGTSTPALTRGFGSVFSDVDLANTTSLELFGATNNSLGTFFAPGIGGNQTFSFLGVSFASPLISRVRITNGSQILATGNTATDLVVMDDFIYAEPVAATVPEGGNNLLLFALAASALMVFRQVMLRRATGVV